MTRSAVPMLLGVNVDHVATLRQARGTSYPDPCQAALMAEQAGADSITVHLREDRRHIQDADIYALRESLTTRMNLEMANNPDIVEIALDVKPEEVCMVPERREELRSFSPRARGSRDDRTALPGWPRTRRCCRRRRHRETDQAAQGQRHPVRSRRPPGTGRCRKIRNRRPRRLPAGKNEHRRNRCHRCRRSGRTMVHP